MVLLAVLLFAALFGLTRVLHIGFASAAPAPPPPTITSSPASPTSLTSASFSFTDSQAGVIFLCKLDAAAFAACTSPKRYTGLAAGSHTFKVKASDGKKMSATTSFTWKVDLTPPPAPSLTSTPPDPSGSTSASLSFTDAEAGVAFRCKLDAGAYGACTSAKSYTGLAAGPHTFAVQAKDAAGNLSATISYTWMVDLTSPPPPPPPSIVSTPADPTNLMSASFSFTNTQAGVTFLCALDGSAFAACTSPKSYSGLSDGSHTFAVRAVDAAGNSSAIASYTWTVDTTPPLAPVFTRVPPDPNNVSTSSFDWTPHLPATDVDHYECSAESGPFGTVVPSVGGPDQSCKPLLTYAVRTTDNGQHQFAVHAVDAAGNVSEEITYKWKVAKGSTQNFTITGDADGLLYPGGAPRAVLLTLHNPNDLPIYVTELTVSATMDAPAGCNHNDLVLRQVDLSTATSSPDAIVVPANGDITLPMQGVGAPTIRLLDNGTDEAPACANQTFSLSYDGSAHS